MESARTRNLAAIVPVYAVALVAGTFGMMVVAPLGLVAPEWAVWPMTLVFGAQVGALGAAWVASLVPPRGARSDIVQTTIGGWAVGIVVGLVTLAIYGGPSPRLVNLAITLVIYMAMMAIPATMLALNLVRSRRPARVDLLLTLGLLVLGLAFIGGATAVVCTVSQCGA
jgi:hypothetical protein